MDRSRRLLVLICRYEIYLEETLVGMVCGLDDVSLEETLVVSVCGYSLERYCSDGGLE